MDTTNMAQAPPQVEAIDSQARLHTWLWQPNLIVFISSGCIMILELVAGRIIAPYVGVSLYTWTSVIGIVLAGISLGNYVGGQLADKWASLPFLGGIFVVAGLSSFGILAVDFLGSFAIDQWSVVAEILILTTALFFLPSFILGSISPMVAKLAVHDLAKTGITVGKIYAAGTAGSIIGTFMTGFFLISWFGTHVIVWGVALVLIAMGLLFTLGNRWLLLIGPVIILSGLSSTAVYQGWLDGPCLRETNYFCIKVSEREREGGPVRILVLDRLVHSHSSMDDPTKLVYGYEKIYAEVTDYRVERDDHLRMLFIGGGGYTFPRYIEHIYPNSDIHVIEIDPGVSEIAHELLGVAQDTSIVSFNQDARLFLQQPPTERYDMIMGDAFNDFSVPYHLTTHEFNERVRAWLTDDGLYVVNIVDGVSRDFLRSYTFTLQQSFAHVYLIPTAQSWQVSPRTPFVLIATATPLDLDAFKTIPGNDTETLLTQLILSETAVNNVLNEDYLVLLTDKYAPVDQMLAPVVRGERTE